MEPYEQMTFAVILEMLQQSFSHRFLQFFMFLQIRAGKLTMLNARVGLQQHSLTKLQNIKHIM